MDLTANNFNYLVRNILTESPDQIVYNGKEYVFDSTEANPQTYFICDISVRKNVKKGYSSDEPSSLGKSIIYCPTPIEDEYKDEYYLEDPLTQALSHWNLSQLLIYNKTYDYDYLKALGIKVYSFKQDADSYFEKVRKVYPNFAFTMTQDDEQIALKYRGRLWQIGDEVVVSMWEFNEKVAEKFIIPFLKNSWGVTEDKIIFETTPEKTKGSTFIIGSKLSAGGQRTIEPWEKEIAQLVAKLHTATGEEKNKIKNQIKELALKHGKDPQSYGITGEETMKPSQTFAQKVLGTSKEPFAKVKAKAIQSENLHQRNYNSVLR